MNWIALWDEKHVRLGWKGYSSAAFLCSKPLQCTKIITDCMFNTSFKMLKEGWWRHPVVVGKRWAVWIQILSCRAIWPQDKGPKAVLARFYSLITDTGYDTQREYTLSDPCQALRDTETKVHFLLSLLLPLFFLFLLLQVAFAFWLQLNFFLRTEAKKVCSALVCSASSSVIKGCLWEIFPLSFVNTTPYSKWTKLYPKALMMFLCAFLQTKSYQETHNLCQIAVSRLRTNACSLCSMD